MEMLGMYLFLDKNNLDQFKYMRTKALIWEFSIQADVIQKYEALHAPKSIVPQTFKYPLTEMILTHKEC